MRPRRPSARRKGKAKASQAGARPRRPADEAHAARRHQAGPDDRDAQAPRGRHGRADRRGHRLAAPHDPRRHLRRAQEEARAHGRGHPHPRGRPQQDRRQGQQHRLPDHRLARRPAERGAPTCTACSSNRAIGSTRPTAPRPGPCSPSRASAQPTSTGLSPASNAPRAPRSAPSSGSTRTACSGPAARLATRTCPTPADEPFIPLLWLKVHELLGRVPEGSTARFVKDGTLPGEAQGQRHRLPDRQLKPRSRSTDRHPALRRRGLAPGGDLFAALSPRRRRMRAWEASWPMVRGIGG